MAGVNKVFLVGHLGKDPDVRTLESGVKVASFSLATSEPYRNKDNEKVEHTEWHNIVAYRGLAEVIEKYVRKGQLVCIEGRIRSRSYEKDGQKKYITEIWADNMQMLGAKKEGSPTQEQTSNPPAEVDPPDAPDAKSDDLPF
jgi:single-strand DNA-binding protein